MKISTLCIILIFYTIIASGQIYIAGDSSGRYVYSPEVHLVDDELQIKIDCWDDYDLRIVSNHTSNHMNDWPTLRFYFPQGVNVLYMGAGYVGRFDAGDTILLGQATWTPNLGHIYGLGEAGPYGTPQIDSQYIAFRKITEIDTHYVFLLISTLYTQLTLHQIISECPDNPLSEITAVEGVTPNASIAISPNPVNDQLFINTNNPEEGLFVVFDLMGRVSIRQTISGKANISTYHMAPGMYFYNLDLNSRSYAGKILKQ